MSLILTELSDEGEDKIITELTEPQRYKSFFKKATSWYNETYGVSNDNSFPADPGYIADSLVKDHIPLKAFIHMVYINKFPDASNLFKGTDLKKIGLYIDFLMNGDMKCVVINLDESSEKEDPLSWTNMKPKS